MKLPALVQPSISSNLSPVRFTQENQLQRNHCSPHPKLEQLTGKHSKLPITHSNPTLAPALKYHTSLQTSLNTLATFPFEHKPEKTVPRKHNITSLLSQDCAGKKKPRTPLKYKMEFPLGRKTTSPAPVQFLISPNLSLHQLRRNPRSSRPGLKQLSGKRVKPTVTPSNPTLIPALEHQAPLQTPLYTPTLLSPLHKTEETCLCKCNITPFLFF